MESQEFEWEILGEGAPATIESFETSVESSVGWQFEFDDELLPNRDVPHGLLGFTGPNSTVVSLVTLKSCSKVGPPFAIGDIVQAKLQDSAMYENTCVIEENHPWYCLHFEDVGQDGGRVL